MDSALILQREHAFAADDVVAGEVLVPEGIVPVVCEPLADKQIPTATYGALFSLPFCVATNLVHGHARLDNFTEEARQDKAVLALAGKIGYDIEPMPEFPTYFCGGVRLELKNGQRLEHREMINRGHPDNPMEAADVQAKFRDNARRVLSDARIDAVIEAVDRLEELSNVAQLAALCVPE